MQPLTAVIVQARYGSTRLPGKVLLELAGHRVLEHVLHRCLAIREAGVVCCAIPLGSEDDPVAECAARCGVDVFRGERQDVLDRYYRAAQALNASVVLRVTADCPLIDPAICDAVLKLRAERSADYACNNMPRGMPHGLDCEAMPFTALERAAREADDAASREHVTPWLRTRKGFRRVNLDATGGAGLRWTLDYPEDLAFLSALFAKLPPWPAIPATAEVLEVVARNPELSALNARWAEPAASQRRPG
jgi:spore coat polysaccharide biosynthesis protein SpsF (cytidylyltransferase family)